MQMKLYTSKQGILNTLEGKTLFAELNQSAVSNIEITVNSDEIIEISDDIFVIKVNKR